jgi:hypothetical protein
MHTYLAESFTKLTGGDFPVWLMAGVMLLPQKSVDAATDQKLLTSLMASYNSQNTCSSNCKKNSKLCKRWSEKGCCKGLKGCKEQLLVSKFVPENCVKMKKAFMCYV